MSITWRIKVYDEGFTSRTQPGKANNILTPADAFASLDSFDVEGSGNCLEARFRCVPSLVDIRPRDVIELEVSEDGGSSYTRVYRGYIVVAGNARSTEIEAYKAVGLKQRFYDKVNTLRVVDGDDIATMASDVHSQLITDSYLPGGVAALSADAPTLSIVLGNRYPQLETVGATYDALAQQAGAFIVASGTTYTYDGVTYEAGETVPAVQWGVDADGNLFFKRWQRDAILAAESDDDKLVKYNEVAAEKVYDSVQLVYFDKINKQSFTEPVYAVLLDGKVIAFNLVDPDNVIVFPLTRRFDFGGDANNTLTVLATSPLDLMENNIDALGNFSNVSNSSNINDGNSGTYAVVGPTSGTGSFFVETNTPESTNTGFVAKIVVQRDSSTNYVKLTSGRLRTNSLELPTTDVFDLYFYFLPGYSNDPNNEQFLALNGSAAIGGQLFVEGSNLRVFEVEFLRPAVDGSGTADEEYAKRFLRSVNTDVAEVSQFGSLGAVSQTMAFTPSGESAVSVPVERVSYRLSTREGLVTTYHLGQAYDAELLSERAVLEALAARSVS